jgi:RNA polymerase sigma-70 factor (ECF subfamily)
LAELNLSINDSSLVQGCLSKDEQSFATLYHRYAKGVYHAAWRIVNNTAEAEDIVQDAFCKAFEQIDKLKEQNNFEGWVKRIAINQAISCIRKRKVSFVNDEGLENLQDETVDIDEEEIFQYQVQEVKAAIAALPDGYRSILSLYLFEDQSQEDIAKLLGISAVTVRSQYHRAKKKVYQTLKTLSHGKA